jgi:hypothetical protein
VKPSTNQAIVKNIKTVIKPPTRSAHGMLSFKNQYVIVIGGECNPSPEEDARDEDDEETCSRNDVWLFDITRQDWIKIEPKTRFSSTGLIRPVWRMIIRSMSSVGSKITRCCMTTS